MSATARKMSESFQSRCVEAPTEAPEGMEGPATADDEGPAAEDEGPWSKKDDPPGW